MSDALGQVGELAQEFVTQMTAEDLRRISATVLNRWRKTEIPSESEGPIPVTAEELQRTEIVEEERGRPVGVRAVYELRYTSFRVRQPQALAGSREMFEYHVWRLVEESKKLLDQAQPGLTWGLVQFFVEPQRVTRNADRTFTDTRDGSDVARSMQAALMSGDTTGNRSLGVNTKTAPRRVEDVVWIYHLVWADLAGGGHFTDPMMAHEQRPGPMARYAETRQLRHMTPAMSRNRREAIALLKRTAESSVAPGVVDALTAEQRQGILTLHSAGMNAALIAKTIGCATDAVVQVIAAAQPRTPAPLTRDLAAPTGDAPVNPRTKRQKKIPVVGREGGEPLVQVAGNARVGEDT